MIQVTRKCRTNWVVYLHYRLDTGECFYIGKGRPERAFVKTRRNKYWTSIVNKIGYKVVIAQNFNKEHEAFDFEVDLIKRFNPSCNFTEGGEGSSGVKVSNSARQRRSERSLKMWANPEFKNSRLPELLKNLNDPMVKAKMSASKLEFFKNKEHRISRAIGCGAKPFLAFKDGIFLKEEISASEFARDYGLFSQNINACLRGKKLSYKGYTFKYKEV